MSQLWVVGNRESDEHLSPQQVIDEVRSHGFGCYIMSAKTHPAHTPIEAEVYNFGNASIEPLEKMVERLPIGYLTLIVMPDRRIVSR